MSLLPDNYDLTVTLEAHPRPGTDGRSYLTRFRLTAADLPNLRPEAVGSSIQQGFRGLVAKAEADRIEAQAKGAEQE